MISIYDFTRQTFAEWILRHGLPRFRAAQLFAWVYGRRVFDFEQMSNISRSEKDLLSRALSLELPAITQDGVVESLDGSCKFLCTLTDGRCAEAVLIPGSDRLTLCVSCMIGCPLGCAFCATGMQIGFVRNLSTAEIIGQILAIERYSSRKITNIVFMGMGEPLLNRAAVEPAIQNLLDPQVFGLSRHHVTVSTAGVTQDLASFINAYRVRLAVSIHFPTDRQRSDFMPVNRAYPLATLISELQRIDLGTRDYITIEYLMLDRINDSLVHAAQLVRLLAPLRRVKINLIPYNASGASVIVLSHNGQLFKKTDSECVEQFAAFLVKKGLRVTVRRSAGVDVEGGCGQLSLRKGAF